MDTDDQQTDDGLGGTKVRGADRVVAAILELVRQGRLRTGERLPTEESLCTRFGVSRTVVREALQQLKARGLVRARRGSGTYVEAAQVEQIGESLSLFTDRADSLQDWTDLLEMRALIETESARRLAAQPSAEALAEAREALRAMKNAKGNLKAFAAADIAFHVAIVAASGNRLFQSVHRSLVPMAHRFAAATYTSTSQLAEGLREHSELLDVIARGGPEKGALRMQKHLQESARHMLAMFSKQAKVSGP